MAYALSSRRVHVATQNIAISFTNTETEQQQLQTLTTYPKFLPENLLPPQPQSLKKKQSPKQKVKLKPKVNKEFALKL